MKYVIKKDESVLYADNVSNTKAIKQLIFFRQKKEVDNGSNKDIQLYLKIKGELTLVMA